MQIKAIAAQANTTARTIQRDIAAFNKKNGTDHSDSLKEDVSDPDLLEYIRSKRSIGFQQQDKSVQQELFDDEKSILPNNNGIDVQSGVKTKKRRYIAPVKSQNKKKTDLQTRLSADWLILSVLIVILFADMFSFGLIGDHEVGDRFDFAWVFFALMGLAAGLGSVVTYNRIEDEKLAMMWKIVFGVLQFLVFEFAINEKWIVGGIVMMSMLVLVFVGAQRSIKG